MTGADHMTTTGGPRSPRSDMIQERLAVSRQPVPKQTPEERISNFEETYRGFDIPAAIVEAGRCLDCPSAPCTTACPVSNDIPAALMLLERGELEAAANKFRETSTLPEMCGRLCPQERLCEGACVVGFAIRTDGTHHPPVAIGRLEAFLTDTQRAAHGGFPMPETLPTKTGRTCAIIGSGPAGITVAEQLQRRGHQCTVFEAWPEPGGVLLYGIPNFKMRKEILAEKIAYLRGLGVEFRTNTRVGTDVSLADLHDRDGFDAIFLGTGAWVGGRLGIEGEEHLQNVYSATEFLVRGNLDEQQLPDDLREPPYTGDDVVVVGGGDTSMDCVRTAVRLGAKHVTLVYRRTDAEMQGREEERRHAAEEGVRFEFLTTPIRLIGDDDGKVAAIELIRMTLGEPDASGRRRPVPLEGSNFTIPATAVITAIGYNADEQFTKHAQVETDRWNLVRVDEKTHRTNVPYIFAGGDVVNGADLVVTAIADAKVASTWIHQYLVSLDTDNYIA
jgi:glutamate synthase (NADPH/NADH) small chain